ncbi:hypothetical protein [Aquimarina sp. Aq78]|uniref:hypothetical protein n=1 Tax=Aquimarina sp. Aq78 TaxID=1191889 RepID=UPI000D0FFD99|nr:hypothetical protein [Aquimarina sp. Aq78]
MNLFDTLYGNYEHHFTKSNPGMLASMYLNHGDAFSTFATIATYTKGEEWINKLVVYSTK